MSDDDRDKDPDYEPEPEECNTVNFEDFKEEVATITNTDRSEHNTGIRVVKKVLSVKKDRRTSLIWSKFTVVDKKERIAACNICGVKLLFRSTSNNLKKHLERKHNYCLKKGVVNKKVNRPAYVASTPRPNVSELAGISEKGITVKVIGENGQTEHFELIGGEEFITDSAAHEEEVHEHDYSSVHHRIDEGDVIEIGGENVESEHPRIENVISSVEERTFYQSKPNGSSRQYTPYKSSTFCGNEKNKRNKIIDLQIECLENKKYNMQLEALSMEQQLNLPRSIFTQPLHYSDVQTRSTQTDVGGNDTRVFYVTNGRGGRPIQQLFAFEDLDL